MRQPAQLGTTPRAVEAETGSDSGCLLPAAEVQRAEKSAVGQRRQRRFKTSEREGSREQTHRTRKTGTADALDGVRS